PGQSGPYGHHGRFQPPAERPTATRDNRAEYATAPRAPYATTSSTTTQCRRPGEVADRPWGDVTTQMRPVRPHDQDSRNAR
ncbi:MAG TPA: glycosyl transferase, partial [Streptomyces sp.]|nr:glycosyl transferase [Streptomyces sp.]